MKGWKNITVKENVFDKVSFIADSLGYTKSKTVSEVFENLFDFCFKTLKPDGNAVMWLDGVTGKLIVNVIGKKTLISGAVDVPENASDTRCDLEVKEKLESILNEKNLSEVEKDDAKRGNA